MARMSPPHASVLANYESKLALLKADNADGGLDKAIAHQEKVIKAYAARLRRQAKRKGRN